MAEGGKKLSNKVMAKTGGVKQQWDIMLAMHIDPTEIPKFADPDYWLKCVPRACLPVPVTRTRALAVCAPPRCPREDPPARRDTSLRTSRCALRVSALESQRMTRRSPATCATRHSP